MVTCHISKQQIAEGEAVKGSDIRDGIYQMIGKQYPDFDAEKYISIYELNRFRRYYLAYLVEQEKGELAKIDKDVVNAIRNNILLSTNIREESEVELRLGQRLADMIATFGGSWTFIIFFFAFIVLWIGVNLFVLTQHSFDPYPFILLNLILSCLAAIQAPIIMMSQNRQEQKDRLRSEHDYQINLKAELEIQLLNEKMDHLIVHQNKKLLEIQAVQIDYLDDVMSLLKSK
jgi:uncharacterized membrane protein